MGLVKDALKHIDMNIACSDKVKRSYQELFGVEKICVVNNLMDDQRIYSLSLEPQNITPVADKINLICVARFHHQKGLDRLIKAYAKVKDAYHLVIIGDGELKEELYKLAKDLNVFDDIEWLGMRANPYADIRASELFVLPSLYEGYPTITVESLISDTPILALEVAGVKEQIVKPEYGWVVENSEEALTEKLIELKDQKVLLNTYKEELKTYKYDNESILNRYYEIFN